MGIVSSQSKNKISGFTIVELVIVLVIISVLVSIGVVAYLGMNDRAKEIAKETKLRNTQKQLEAHRTIYGQYPKTVDCSKPVGIDNICLEGQQGPLYIPDDDGFRFGIKDDKKKVIDEIDQDGKITQTPMAWKQVSVGGNYSCGIYYDDKVYCWGYNGYGEVGVGSAETKIFNPTAIKGDLANKRVKLVTTGRFHVCALTLDGQAYCWGWNNWGEVGDGTYQEKRLPVKVKATTPEDVLYDKTIKQISASNRSTCAVASDNKAYCWGDNSNHQAGTGVVGNLFKPHAVQGDLAMKNIDSVLAGSYHSCALTVDREFYCWGYNSGYQPFGFKTNDEKGIVKLPTLANDSLLAEVELRRLVLSFTDQGPHSCAIGQDNKAYCWGSNDYGQLGNGVSVGGIRQISLKDESNSDQVKDISTGNRYTCAISLNNKAYCWGYNNYGQLGNNTKTISQSPVAVQGEIANKVVSGISAGMNHTCAIADGDIYCWGRNVYGELGDGTTNESLLPIKIKDPIN